MKLTKESPLRKILTQLTQIEGSMCFIAKTKEKKH